MKFSLVIHFGKKHLTIKYIHVIWNVHGVFMVNLMCLYCDTSIKDARSKQNCVIDTMALCYAIFQNANLFKQPLKSQALNDHAGVLHCLFCK